jgi:hypothetical protein
VPEQNQQSYKGAGGKVPEQNQQSYGTYYGSTSDPFEPEYRSTQRLYFFENQGILSTSRGA